MRHGRSRTVISGANPISAEEAACERGPCPRRVPARSRAPANFKRGSDGSALGGASCDDALLFRRWCAREMRPPSNSGNPKAKARCRFPGAGFCSSCDDGEMPVICPTCQIFFWMGLKRPTGPRAGATNRCPSECSSPPNEKTRGQLPGAGFCNSCDDGDMPVICPTCQTFLKQPPILPPTPLVKPLHWRHGFSGGDRLGRFCHRQRRRPDGGLLLGAGARLRRPPGAGARG